MALAASVAIAPLVSATAASAQEDKGARLQPVTYNIPAQPLAGALTAFARASGLKIAYPARLTAGKSAGAISGPYTRTGVLDQLLAGSGLAYRFTADDTVTILDPSSAGIGGAGAVEGTGLDPIIVTGREGTTEGTGSYTTSRMSTATGLGLSIRETPQAVAVVSRQRLTDQRITSVEDAMVNAPGVIFKKKATADDNEKGLFSRSMEITNMQVDGVNMHKDFKALSLDTALYDRIEIVRGSTGLMSGTGNPAASVNLFRKKPTDTFQAEINGTVG